MDVLAKAPWSQVDGGAGTDNNGIEGQLTKLRWRGVIIYVREVVPAASAFTSRSGVRQGLHSGLRCPPVERQALELRAPAGVWNCDDNCPDVPNPRQEDSDGDGVGAVWDRAMRRVGDLERSQR